MIEEFFEVYTKIVGFIVLFGLTVFSIVMTFISFVIWMGHSADVNPFLVYYWMVSPLVIGFFATSLTFKSRGI